MTEHQKETTFLRRNERNGIGTILDALLPDQFALGARMRNCHWNVTCPQSPGLKTLFASHHEVLDEILVDMAERARLTGNSRTAALAEFFRLALSKAQPGGHPQAPQITAELLAGHEAVIYRLRGNLEACADKHGDVNIRDFLSGMITKHESMVGDLRAVVEETRKSRTDGQANKVEAQETENQSQVIL